MQGTLLATDLIFTNYLQTCNRAEQFPVFTQCNYQEHQPAATGHSVINQITSDLYLNNHPPWFHNLTIFRVTELKSIETAL